MPSYCKKIKRGTNCCNAVLAMAVTASYFLTNLVEGSSCAVNLTITDDVQVGFLTPTENEREFLACFHELDDQQHELSLYFHEFYLPHAHVKACLMSTLDLLDTSMFDESDFDESDFDRHCISPLSSDLATSITVHFSFYINITLTLSPSNHVILGPFPDRPLFNITYYLRPKEVTARSAISLDSIRGTYLQHCNLNGIPTIYATEEGEYFIGCECRNHTFGDRCQWGGNCSSTMGNELCHHGHCRFQAGMIMCVCDDDYFGHQCEYHKHSLVSYDQTCGGQLDCQQKCHMWHDEPFCSCEIGYVQNGTHCTLQDLLWDVTVKFIAKNSISANQTLKKLFQQFGLLEKDLSILHNYSSGEVKAHFYVKDELKDNMTVKEDWNKALNTTVYIETQPRFSIVKLEQFVVSDSAIIMQCVAIGSLPLLFKWYKDGHLIYEHNVTSCQKSVMEYGKLTVSIYKESYVRQCRMELMLKDHDPMIDYGPYTCEVTDSKYGTAKNNSLINDLTSPLRVVVSPEVTTVEKGADLTILCTTQNTWYGGSYYIMSWELSSEEAVESSITRSQFWNGSYISLYNIRESVNVTCFVRIHGSADTKSKEVARIIVLSSGYGFCPLNSSWSITWPLMAVGEESKQPCPIGYRGTCSRKCQQNSNYAFWSLPDCSTCIYAPLMEVAENPEVILQGHGYPFAIKDGDATAKLVLEILQNHAGTDFPDELFGILSLMRNIISALRNPVTLYKYLEIVQHLLVFPHSNKSGWNLREMTTEFIRRVLKYKWFSKPVEAFQDIGVHVHWALEKNTSFSVNTLAGLPCGGLKVDVSRTDAGLKKDSVILNIGVVFYSRPHQLLDNITSNWRMSQSDEMPVVLIDAPLVDVVAQFSNDSELSGEINLFVTKIMYKKHEAPIEDLQSRAAEVYNWSTLCGQISFKEWMVDWDFSICSKINESNEGTIECLCKGQGLFGLFMKASITKEMSLYLQPEEVADGTSIVLATCCAVLLAILFFTLIILVRWSPGFSQKVSSLFRNKNVQFNWQDFPTSENCNVNANYLSATEAAEHLVPSGNKIFQRTVSNMSNTRFPENYLPNSKDNGVEQENSNTDLNESDNVYMTMDPVCEGALANTFAEMNPLTYINITGSSHSFLKCALDSKQPDVDIDSMSDDNKWVLTSKESQQIGTYLPMKGIIGQPSSQDNSH